MVLKRERLSVLLLATLLLVIVSVLMSGPINAANVVTIKLYHADAAYNHEIIAAFEKKNPNIKVQIVPIDFGNAAQIIKTGIISGNPVDVSFFWGTAMKSHFVDTNMATDLTPYLEADKKWKDSFVQGFLNGSKVNGKYYATPYSMVLESLYANMDLFKKYNVKIPTDWAEYLNACEVFKKNGIYGMAAECTVHHQLLVYAYQLMIDSGKIDDITQGKVPFFGPNEAPGLRQCLEMWRDVYKKGYWYPGEGALTVNTEEVRAAYYQGKAAMMYDAGNRVKEHHVNSKYDSRVIRFPIVNKSRKYALNIVTNALFIPYNAKYKNEAVEFIKFYTSEDGQKVILASGRGPVIKSLKIEDQLLAECLATAAGDDVVSYSHLQNLSPKIDTYISKELVASVCTGTSIDEALKKLESFRQEAIK